MNQARDNVTSRRGWCGCGLPAFRSCIAFVVGALVSLSAVSSASAESGGLPSNSGTPQAYCGLYAVYGAALHEGLDPDFSLLLKPKYAGCSEGSSVRELEQAAQDLGLYALTFTQMTPSILRRESRPIVLHVRNTLEQAAPNHYVLFVGFRNKKYVVIDGGDRREWHEAELLSRWASVGIIISRHAISPSATMASARTWNLGYLVAFALGAVGIASLSNVPWFAKCKFRGLTPVAVVAGAFVVAGVCYHAVYPADSMRRTMPSLLSRLPARIVSRRGFLLMRRSMPTTPAT